MAGGVGHTGGLTNPRPWRGRFQAGYSNTSGPSLASKEGAFTKKTVSKFNISKKCQSSYIPVSTTMCLSSYMGFKLGRSSFYPQCQKHIK